VFQRTGEGDEGILEEYASEGDEEPCYGKRCTANEHCCPGSVCVDVDGVEVVQKYWICYLVTGIFKQFHGTDIGCVR
jgi:hypothetical protein